MDNIYSIEDIKREHEAAGGYFFSPASMKFFKSRVLDGVYRVSTRTEKRVLFITSEKKCFDDPTRVYSINVFNPETGRVETWRKSTFSSARRARMFANDWQRHGVLPEKKGDLDD